MIGLPEKLEKIEGLHHSIYAADITLWMTGAATATSKTPYKRRSARWRNTSPHGDWPDGRNGETINILKAATYQISRLIGRIAGRSYGRREKNLVRVVRAFVMSRLAYVIPSLKLGVAEKIKVECLIRKANLGLRYEVQRGQKVDVPLHIREKLNIPLLPRRLHLVHHAERRTARAKALKKQLNTEAGVIFVDAAEYDKKLKAMMAVAVDREGLIIASSSVRTTAPEVAEEVAVAHALNILIIGIVVSDSQTAIRNFARGRVSPETLRVLRGFDKTMKTKLVWTPAHSSLPGNEEAHDAARGLTNRAEVPSDPSTASLSGRDRLTPKCKNKSSLWPKTPPGSSEGEMEGASLAGS
ncbi:hypothetical protein HPB47_028094 [Ixodes persulcatus]|uniref:Uncharacterized protein n=1 Tax=Ixodes persulcatus TaxID=34615 RepID=A0AC60PU84_IXOPE|nr:hypothetical protein HPB47_028094 [Ixodes persulcatus]